MSVARTIATSVDRRPTEIELAYFAAMHNERAPMDKKPPPKTVDFRRLSDKRTVVHVPSKVPSMRRPEHRDPQEYRRAKTIARPSKPKSVRESSTMRDYESAMGNPFAAIDAKKRSDPFKSSLFDDPDFRENDVPDIREEKETLCAEIETLYNQAFPGQTPERKYTVEDDQETLMLRRQELYEQVVLNHEEESWYDNYIMGLAGADILNKKFLGGFLPLGKVQNNLQSVFDSGSLKYHVRRMLRSKMSTRGPASPESEIASILFRTVARSVIDSFSETIKNDSLRTAIQTARAVALPDPETSKDLATKADTSVVIAPPKHATANVSRPLKVTEPVKQKLEESQKELAETRKLQDELKKQQEEFRRTQEEFKRQQAEFAKQREEFQKRQIAAQPPPVAARPPQSTPFSAPPQPVAAQPPQSIPFSAPPPPVAAPPQPLAQPSKPRVDPFEQIKLAPEPSKPFASAEPARQVPVQTKSVAEQPNKVLDFAPPQPKPAAEPPTRVLDFAKVSDAPGPDQTAKKVDDLVSKLVPTIDMPLELASAPKRSSSSASHSSHKKRKEPMVNPFATTINEDQSVFI